MGTLDGGAGAVLAPPHNLYSVRMRAATGGPHESGGRHVSGAERIVAEGLVNRTVAQFLKRARGHGAGEPDFIQVTVERLDLPVTLIPALPVTTVKTGRLDVDPPREGGDVREIARFLLYRAGVHPDVVEKAMGLLDRGPGPEGTAAQGALLLDPRSGERREPNHGRGVRVTRLDWEPSARRSFVNRLRRQGESVESLRRAAEALAIASKAAWAGTLAEVCFSDNPGYTTGYVASPLFGYVRLPGLKRVGSSGGRVFFPQAAAPLGPYLEALQTKPVLVSGGPSLVRVVAAEVIRDAL